jgi:hypothetical protein
MMNAKRIFKDKEKQRHFKVYREEADITADDDNYGCNKRNGEEVYFAESYWVFGLFPFPGILGSRNTTFRKLDLFPSSGKMGERTPTQVGLQYT